MDKKKRNKEKAEKECTVRPVLDDENSSEKRLQTRAELYIDWPKFIAFFNETLLRHNSVIRPLQFVTRGMKARAQLIVYRFGTKKVLVEAVENMAASDFLNGRVQRKGGHATFVASFIWLLSKDEIFDRVLNGYYDNPPELPITREEQRRLAAEEREERRRQQAEEARRIADEEHERMVRQREENRRNAARGEELQRIFDEIQLPPLSDEEKSRKWKNRN